MTSQTETELRKALYELATEVAEKAAEIVRIDATARAMLAALHFLLDGKNSQTARAENARAAIAQAEAAGINHVRIRSKRGCRP